MLSNACIKPKILLKTSEIAEKLNEEPNKILKLVFKYIDNYALKTVNKVVGRQTQKGNFGTFQENEFRKVRASNKTYEHHGKTHTATSYDNPQRHNFIPNRRQIQAAIHVQEADTT